MKLERRDSGNYHSAGTATIERVKGARVFAGYGAVFFNARDPGTEYQITRNTVERISPAAFDKTLAGSDDVIGAYNHDVNYLLGRRSNDTLRLSKDAKGLAYQIDYNEADPQHQTVMAKISRGDLNGSSFSFLPVKETTVPNRDGYIRTIEDVILYELGPVWAAAYKSASAFARSPGAVPGSVRWCLENPDAAKRYARLQQIERDLELDRRNQAVAVRLRLIEIDN